MQYDTETVLDILERAEDNMVDNISEVAHRNSPGGMVDVRGFIRSIRDVDAIRSVHAYDIIEDDGNRYVLVARVPEETVKISIEYNTGKFKEVRIYYGGQIEYVMREDVWS